MGKLHRLLPESHKEEIEQGLLPLLPYLESDYDRESHDQKVAETASLKDALVHLV